MHTDRKEISSGSGRTQPPGTWGPLALGLIVLLVVVLTASSLWTTLNLNLGYLELARRTPSAAGGRAFFQQAAAVEPHAPRVSRALGVLALTQGDPATAYAALKRAAADGANDSLTHWQLARALDGMGNAQAAAAEYRLAGASDFFLNAALRLRHQKDWSGAEQNFLRALEIAPQDASLARSVGEFYSAWRKPDLATVYLQRALDLEHRAYERALLRGELSELAHNSLAAERAFQEAIDRMPAHPDGYRLLAELYLERRDVEGAIRTLEKGSTHATMTFGINLRLAQLFTENKNWTAAQAALERAQSAQANSDEVYLIRAQLEFGRNLPDAALAALEHALTLAPYNAETHFWRGRALAETGQCEAARRAYAEALTLAPDDPRFAPAQQTFGTCQSKP